MLTLEIYTVQSYYFQNTNLGQNCFFNSPLYSTEIFEPVHLKKILLFLQLEITAVSNISVLI